MKHARLRYARDYSAGVSDKHLSKLTGVRFHMSQLRGLFVKRVLHTYRNFTLTIAQILVSLISRIALMCFCDVLLCCVTFT